MTAPHTIRKDPLRRELDQDTWADLDRIEYRFQLVGNGGALAGPFMFGRAFDAPPHPTFSVVVDLDGEGLERCTAPMIYDQNLVKDPTFANLRTQIPSITNHFAIDSEKRPVPETPGGENKVFLSEQFHFIANSDPFPVSGAESSLRLDEKHDIHYPAIPSVGQWGLEQIGWDGIPFYLDEDVAYESGWALQCRIDDVGFLPLSFPGGPNFYTQWSCGHAGAFVPFNNEEGTPNVSAGRRHIPYMGRVNPGDTINFSIWAWGGTNATWDWACTIHDQNNQVVSRPIVPVGQSVEPTRTKHTFDIEVPVPPHDAPGQFLSSGNAYWFSLSTVLVLPINRHFTWTAQIDRVEIKITRGGYSLGLTAPNHTTIGVSEWIQDEQGMYVGANLWCRARGIHTSPTDVLAEAQVTFKGQVLKGYSNIHKVEPKTAPLQVVMT